MEATQRGWRLIRQTLRLQLCYSTHVPCICHGCARCISSGSSPKTTQPSLLSTQRLGDPPFDWAHLGQGSTFLIQQRSQVPVVGQVLGLQVQAVLQPVLQESRHSTCGVGTGVGHGHSQASSVPLLVAVLELNPALGSIGPDTHPLAWRSPAGTPCSQPWRQAPPGSSRLGRWSVRRACRAAQPYALVGTGSGKGAGSLGACARTGAPQCAGLFPAPSPRQLPHPEVEEGVGQAFHVIPWPEFVLVKTGCAGVVGRAWAGR